MEGGSHDPWLGGSQLPRWINEVAVLVGGRCFEDDAQLCQQAVTMPSFPLPSGIFNGCKKSLLFPPSLVISVSVDMHFSWNTLMGEKNVQQLDHMPCKISASIDPSLIWGSRALDSLHTKLMPACASPSFSIGSLGLLALRFRFQYPGNLSLFAAILGAVQGILAVVKLGSVVSGLFALWPSAFLPIPLLDHIFIVLTPGICYPGMKPESSHWEL